MTGSVPNEWRREAANAAFSAPVDCSARADKFEGRIRWRNAIEYGAGALVIAVFTISGISTAREGEFLLAISSALLVAGTCLVLWSLYRRAGNIKRLPEEPCVVHLQRQYRLQYNALRAVPKWYLAPLLPGMAMYYAVVATKVARNVGWEQAMSGIAVPALATIALFVIVAGANALAARGLKRQLDKLEMMNLQSNDIGAPE